MMGPLWGFLMWLAMLFWAGLWLFLLVGGAIVLYRYLTRASRHSSFHPGAQHCPSCGRSVQADFRVCPYCAAALPARSGDAADAQGSVPAVSREEWGGIGGRKDE